MQPLSGTSDSTSNAAAFTNAQLGNVQASAPIVSSQSRSTAAASDSGVVLRWRTSTRLSAAPGTTEADSRSSSQAGATAHQPMTQYTSATTHQSHEVSAAAHHLAQDAWSANPLRDSGAAQSATRQSHNTTAAAARSSHPRDVVQSSAGQPRAGQPRAGQPGAGQPGARTYSQVTTATYQPPAGAPSLPSSGVGEGQSAPLTLPSSPAQPMTPDVLDQPELAPPPTTGNATSPENTPPVLPSESASGSQSPGLDRSQAQPQSPSQAELPDPFDSRRSLPDNRSPSDRALRENQDNYDFDAASARPDATVNCDSMRNLLRNATLDKISLNSSPRYGQGLKVDLNDAEKESMAEKQRLDFAATAEEREWCDRHGRTLVRGRMVDLLNEQVVLDINGQRREIPLRDLCDIDLAYVGKAWNLPVSCGMGGEEGAGRGFIPSAIQWKASGLCHKPLYFEEVQLERYGHEIGPILQPLVSTAHFFGNVAVLPYKMGIHPPHECQYALGYYRPGNCAPYMLPPIPFSLRGAATQAGAVVGASALIP